MATCKLACEPPRHRLECRSVRIEAWEHAERIRRYCDHLENRHDGGTSAREWVTWARMHADHLDPVGQVPQMPDQPPKVAPEDLRPFLDGWSPYGPEAKY
jgi:hypothetical protein